MKIVDTAKAPEVAAAVNLCEEVAVGEELVINYTYTDLGRQMMILDIGAPVSIAGVPWMQQYLEEFGLKVEEMKSVRCHQPFVFGPSRRYVSTTLVELPVLITRLDGREDVLVIQTYLVDAEVPFLCGKQTMESWNFRIDGKEKILEIETKSDQECSRKLIKMIDTVGGHYGIILETRRRKDTSVLMVENDTGILFMEDAKEELCAT